MPPFSPHQITVSANRCFGHAGLPKGPRRALEQVFRRFQSSVRCHLAESLISLTVFHLGCHPEEGHVTTMRQVAPNTPSALTVPSAFGSLLKPLPQTEFPPRRDATVPALNPESLTTDDFVGPPSVERHLTVVPGKKSVEGKRGMVVSVNALATRAGVERLAAGGNAIDAAITTAFALAVTHPSAGNIGGGGFALIRLPSGETYALDFREASPEGLNLERFFAMTRGKGDGPDSIGVPGTVAGLYALSERFGKTPMKALIEPARVLAEQGHIIEKREAEGIAVSWSKLKLSPLGRRRWGSREGTPLSIGQRIRLPELAATLKRLQTDGRRGFYEGVTSESIVKESGIPPQIHATDLALYQAKWRKPVSFDYRGLRVTTMPPPSAGGIALMSGLLQLGQYDFSSIPMSSIQRAHLLLEVIRRAQADRLYSVSDPDALTAEERGRRVERWLNPLRWTTIAPISLETATDNERVKIGISEMRESDQTTHLSVVDAEGMAVNLTTTLSSGFGSKVVTETGIVLNNSLGSFSGKGENQPAPARRTTSSMAPTFVDDAEGLRLVLGTPGGDSIPSTLLQLIQLLVDYQIPVDEAVDAPRIHQSVVGRAHARSERKRPIPRELRRKLEAMGHHFTTETAYMGHANTIVILGGIAYGYVDPREGGLALGLPSPSP